MRVTLSFLVLAALFWLFPARAADRVAEALDGNDPFAVQALLQDPRGLSGTEVALLNGAAAAMRFDDRAAVDALTAALRGQMPAAARSRALALLGGVQLRANNYPAALAALDAAVAASDPAGDRLSLQQTRDVAHVLRGEAAQVHEDARPGAAPIKRDAANLARATGRVNGVDQEFILDTGAGFSTITRSTATRLKVRLLPEPITVGSATSKAVPAQLGVADSVEIAGNRFRNTVFLVMADEALSFANGAYKIDAILGFPVLARLGRIEFALDGGDETFRVVAPAKPSGMSRDFYLDVLRPLAIVELSGAGQVRMLLDTGAKRSSLNGTFAAAFPAAMQGAAREKSTFGGAGGMQTVDVGVLRNVAVSADGQVRRIDAITVSAEKKGEHGALGQDVLRAGGGFALDFVAMDFAFLPAR